MSPAGDKSFFEVWALGPKRLSRLEGDSARRGPAEALVQDAMSAAHGGGAVQRVGFPHQRSSAKAESATMSIARLGTKPWKTYVSGQAGRRAFSGRGPAEHHEVWTRTREVMKKSTIDLQSCISDATHRKSWRFVGIVCKRLILSKYNGDMLVPGWKSEVIDSLYPTEFVVIKLN